MKPTTPPTTGAKAWPWWWLGAMALYQVVLPAVLLMAWPGWWLRMLRRGGKGSGMRERAGFYATDLSWEPCGAVHLHAISVGEVMLALRLLRAWRELDPEQEFVMATGTATGHAVAAGAGITGLRVTYAPLDLPFMVGAYLRRFEPQCLVLVEGEVWPNLMKSCARRGIPVSLVNARMSPRSERRYRKFAPYLRPLFSSLRHVALQEEEHREIWEKLGVQPDRIHCTGSLKFDPGSHAPSVRRPEFEEMLAWMGDGPVLLAASTHSGEETYLARAMCEAVPNARILIAPRHAERAGEAAADLAGAGFSVIRRSEMRQGRWSGHRVMLIDTTGELRDWTGHANVVLVGKSFLSTGGQNPAEAMMASIPVVFGPHMENFEPLAGQLVRKGGAIRADGPEAVVLAIRRALAPGQADSMTRSAMECLQRHEGATRRMVDLIRHGRGGSIG